MNFSMSFAQIFISGDAKIIVQGKKTEAKNAEAKKAISTENAELKNVANVYLAGNAKMIIEEETSYIKASYTIEKIAATEKKSNKFGKKSLASEIQQIKQKEQEALEKQQKHVAETAHFATFNHPISSDLNPSTRKRNIEAIGNGISSSVKFQKAIFANSHIYGGFEEKEKQKFYASFLYLPFHKYGNSSSRAPPFFVIS